MSEIRIQEEALRAVLPDLLVMLEKHWYEVEEDEFNPDIDLYYKLADLGIYKMIVARDSQGILGYLAGSLTPRIQSKDHLIATIELLYVDPLLRGSTIASRILKFSEKYFRDLGATDILLSFKTKNGYGKFCEKKGYTHSSSLYHKRLGV